MSGATDQGQPPDRLQFFCSSIFTYCHDKLNQRTTRAVRRLEGRRGAVVGGDKTVAGRGEGKGRERYTKIAVNAAKMAENRKNR